MIDYRSIVCLTFALTACGLQVPEYNGTQSASDETQQRVMDGSPQAVGLLGLLNDGGTTLELLDVDIALDVRAASALIQHRDGADGVFGTADDDLYDTVQEVDDRYYVGSSAMLKLTNWADANGWVPGYHDVLGTYDGVTFTVELAEAIIEMTNDFSLSELDDDVRLDRRAATSIVAAQPLQSVQHLSDQYYVGESALNLLVQYAVDNSYFEGDLPGAPDCNLVVTSATDADAEDLSRLLELSTMSDAPFSEVIGLQATGCDDWQTDPVAAVEMQRQLWNASFHIAYDDGLIANSDIRIIDAPVAGGAKYTSKLDLALVVIDERVGDGDWDPNATAEGAALYADRFDMVDALSAEVDADPGAFVEIDLYFDMEECSEEAIGLIDTRDGSILVVHQFSRC